MGLCFLYHPEAFFSPLLLLLLYACMYVVAAKKVNK